MFKLCPLDQKMAPAEGSLFFMIIKEKFSKGIHFFPEYLYFFK